MTSERPPLQPLERAFTFGFHTPAQLDRLKDATYEILAGVGVRFPSQTALDILAAHGAQVDRTTEIVRFPRELVEKAMAQAPRHFTLGARDPSCDLVLDGTRTYCTTDGCGVEVIDFETRERRASTKADLAHITRMIDYLPGLSFWWPTVSAGDCAQTAQLHELEAGFSNTVKHLQGMVQGEREARYAVQMAAVIAGGAAELRRRPPLSDLTFAVSPLTIDRDGAEAALVFAEAGVPVVLGSAPVCGTTGPATAAGALVQSLAEVLALVSLVQLAVPGAPVFGYSISGSTDPRTGRGGCSLDGRDPALCVDLVHHLGLPSQLGAGGGTDIDLPGTWAEAAQAGPSLTMAAWSGSELTVGLGLTNDGMLWTAEDLILDDDLYHQARYTVMDVAVDDEELALDVIDAVGPGGHFLGQAHTRTHMRETFVRGLASEPDASGGYRDPVAVARERAHDILEHYEPEPLDEAKAAALRRILAAADAELKS